MNRTFASLTDEEKGKILTMTANGISQRKIGEYFGVSRLSILKWGNWIKTGYEPKKQEPSAQEMQGGEKKAFADLTKSDKCKIVNMREQGLLFKQIGGYFGVTAGAAYYWHKQIINKIPKKQAGQARGAARMSRTDTVSFVQNPNPPTATTRMLICHYYDEDVTRYGLNHHQALKDISLELGRTTDYISSVLREEHGKGALSESAKKVYLSVTNSIRFA